MAWYGTQAGNASNQPRACGICGQRSIPRGVEWPWWINGKPVHEECARMKLDRAPSNGTESHSK